MNATEERDRVIDHLEQTVPGVMRPSPPPTIEANVFVISPDGFKAHFKLVFPEAASLLTGLNNLTNLIDALKKKGYTPDSFGNGTPLPVTVAPASAGPGGVAEWLHNQDGSRSCSIHGIGEFVPPGTSRRTGKPYTGFWKCRVQGCKPRGED